jgi:hypothetical protein
MKHPQILSGRHGLPPTSNVPWSTAAEKRERADVIYYFLGMWCFILMSAFVFWNHLWGRGIVSLFGAAALFALLQHHRRQLYAMLLNKPRSMEGLTQWTEHPWSLSTDPDSFRFFCRCGRLIDMNSAPYFKSTNRCSVVCECGRGHFMPWSKDAQEALNRVKR